jgi:hypothetical protein
LSIGAGRPKRSGLISRALSTTRFNRESEIVASVGKQWAVRQVSAGWPSSCRDRNGVCFERTSTGFIYIFSSFSQTRVLLLLASTV